METDCRQAQIKAMEEAILEYYRKAQSKDHNHCQYEDFSNVDDEIKSQFQHGKASVRRNTKTDFTAFKKRFGYELPYEIQDYINLFWHSCIVGFIDDANYCEQHGDEAIVLFEVIKNKNEGDNDLLYHKHGIIYLTETWEKDDYAGKYITTAGKYIPIGWTWYYAYEILYEIETGKIFCLNFGSKGVTQIADSFPQLISKLEP